MNTYFVRYWTTYGSICGITIVAWSSMDAENFARSMPNFNGIYAVDWQ